MFKYPQLALLLALFFAGSMVFYTQRILIPYQRADAALHDHPRGNLSDLYPRWVGARELLLHGRDPYSAEVTREIQAGYYGRPLDPARPGDPRDQQGFAYPVYVVFLLAPSIGVPFSIVRPVFGWSLILLTAGSAFLWLRMLHWRPSSSSLAIIVALTLGSFQAVQGIKLQQLSLLVIAVLAACLAALTEDRLVLAGILLAAATIKPQLTGLLAGWLLLWAISDWARRKRLAWSFGIAMLALLAGAEYVLPGWIRKFLSAIAAYRQYTGAGSPLDELTSPMIGHILAAALVLGLAVVCWKARREPFNSETFVLVTSLVLAVTIVVIPTSALYNQLLLLPAILLVARLGNVLSRTRIERGIRALAVLTIAWPWIASAALTVASAFVAPEKVQRAWSIPLYSSLGIPLAVLVLITPMVAAGLRESGEEETVSRAV